MADVLEEKMETYSEIKNKAIYFLSRREYSKSELTTRLKKYDNFPHELIYQVIDELIEKDYLSDLRFQEQCVKMLLHKGCGPNKINFELKQKGIPNSTIVNLLDELDIDWQEQALQLAFRKYGQKNIKDINYLAKIQRHLYSKGFDTDTIYYVINYYKTYQDYETT